MRYGSVCSGIEAATVAWHPLGWEPAFFSEIEPFPRAVLQHHYPEVPLHGDFTTIQGTEYGPIDLLVGGTPCQSFSVAGLRGGLDDDRGNLALEFLRLADRTRPRWLVWENVPGVLSTNGGSDFGSILGGLVELGYGFAYRVLDAQYFGSAAFRRRVFVVGYRGRWQFAAATLFERECLSGNNPTIRGRLKGRGKSHLGCLAARGPKFDRHDLDMLIYDYEKYTVRFPSVVEFERAQGFPDNYTLVEHRNKPAADSPRYKALGNSMAVPVMRWIGERIEKVNSL